MALSCSPFIILLFLVLVTCEWATPQEREGIAKARKCYSDMLLNSDISHLLLDVTSPEKVDAFCSRISRLKKCIAESEHHLSIAENTEHIQKARGLTAFYLNVCPPGTSLTEQYKGNSPCFQLIKNEILYCGSDLPDMTSFRMRTETSSRCCALKQHRECMYKAVAGYCGSEAGDVTVKILLKYFQHYSEDCESHNLRCIEMNIELPDIGKKYPGFYGSRGGSRKKFYGHYPKETESEDDWSEFTTRDSWKKYTPKAVPSHATSTGKISIGSFIFFLVVQGLRFKHIL